MSLIYLIYCAEVIPGFFQFFMAAAILASGVASFMFFIGLDFWDEDDVKTKVWPKLRSLYIFTLLICTVGLLVPSKETIYTMAAVKYGQEITAKKETQELLGKAYKILNQKLDNVLGEKK